MTEYRYLVVGADGTCKPLHAVREPNTAAGSAAMSAPAPDPFDITDPPFSTDDIFPRLFKQGWTPCRETSLGDGAVLIVMQKGE